MKRLLFVLLWLPLSVLIFAQQSNIPKPKVYIKCSVQEFGKTNKNFAVQLANQLRQDGWSVQTSASKADYILTVDAEARKSHKNVTKEKVNYTYSKRRDTVLIVNSNSSAYNANAIETNAADIELGNYATGGQNSVKNTTVVKDDIIEQKHITPEEYMYFTYLDAHVTVVNSGEVVYENVLEVKEGHINSYEEAARLASKKAIKKISGILRKMK